MKPEDADRLWQSVTPTADGLVPCVVQDIRGGAVLMLAWVSKDALLASAASGWATFWSRSRQCLWVKGATSGNRQALKHVRIDCDGDTLLYVVDAQGPACHEGTDTCFSKRRVGGGWRWDPESVLQDPVIGTRTLLGDVQRLVDADMVEAGSAPSSAAHALINGGIPVQAAQLKADAEAIAHALASDKRADVAEHAADLVYDLAVALRHRNVAFDDILGILRARKKLPGNQ